MNWVPIITTAINAVASIISDKSKAKASKSTQTAAQQAAQDAAIAAATRTTHDAIIERTQATNPRYLELGRKAKKAAIGLGPKLTAAEQAEYDSLKPSEDAKTKVMNDKINAVTNPIAYPDAGLGSGLGSYDNPAQIPNVDIFSGTTDAVKKAGMNPLLMLGIIGGGIGVLYAANKPKSKRRR